MCMYILSFYVYMYLVRYAWEYASAFVCIYVDRYT